MSSPIFRGVLAVALMWLGLTAACAMPRYEYRGRPAQTENRIQLLAGGPHLGVSATQHLSIAYEYSQTDRDLSISAVVDLDQALKTGFNTLERLDIDLNFLDAEGAILATHRVYRSGFRRWILTAELSFEQRVTLPPGADFLLFSYAGRVLDTGSSDPQGAGSAVDWEFWETPLP